MAVRSDEDLDISVVVPTYNEEEYIEDCLEALLDAENPHGSTEILIVDGRSEDRTREIVRRYKEEVDHLELFDNPERTTPEAMNIGMERAEGNVISFISGHSTVPDDFFVKIGEAFDRAPEADVVGGVMDPKPQTYFETGVSGALQSRMGSTSNRFRRFEGYVDTVNFGAYRRRVIDEIGLMDTNLPRGQDYEFNRRVRKNGFKIYQYPDLRIDYHPRSTPTALARQYYGNGYWKTVIFRMYDDYPLPPRVCGFGAITGSLLASMLILPLILYMMAILGVGFQSVVDHTDREEIAYKHLPVIVLALLIMHSSFGIGLVHGSLFEPDRDSGTR